MTTKVAYLHQNAHRNTFVDPKAAYRKLEEWNQSTFSNYYGAEIKTITYPKSGQLNVIRLKGQTPGALVMCGTTKELKASLNAFYEASFRVYWAIMRMRKGGYLCASFGARAAQLERSQKP